MEKHRESTEYKKVVKGWQEKADYALATDLQEEEFGSHFSANRNERRLARQDTREALRLTAEQERYWQDMRAKEIQDRNVATSLQDSLDEESRQCLASTVTVDAEIALRLHRCESGMEDEELARRLQRRESGLEDEELARRLQRRESGLEDEELARRLQKQESGVEDEKLARRLQRRESGLEDEELARRLQAREVRRARNSEEVDERLARKLQAREERRVIAGEVAKKKADADEEIARQLQRLEIRRWENSKRRSSQDGERSQ